MRTAYAVGLALLAFVAGAVISVAAAHPGGMMASWSPEQMQTMLDACQRMMESSSGGA